MEKSAQENFNNIINNYLAGNPLSRIDGKTNEIELRFGNSRKTRPFSKIDYDNVAKALMTYGFKPENPDGFHSLRISHEFLDGKTGMRKMSNIRAEIVGLDLIKSYCQTNSLQKLLDMPSTNYEKLKFTQKTRPMLDDKPLPPADYEEYNLRVSYQLEQVYNSKKPIIRSIIDKWTDSLKTFRLLNRVRLVHDTLPVFADLSIVKSSKTTKNVPMKTYNIQDSEVFESPEKFEIEMELDNSRVGVGTNYENVADFRKLIGTIIKYVLGGIQQTPYPISYKIQDEILNEYMGLVHGDKHENGRIIPRNFIGPSSLTLQMKNIIEIQEDSIVPNIRNNYTVTDKADGLRCLLYVAHDGKLYLITTNMNIINTGAYVDNKDLYFSLLDGEYILHNKNNQNIYLFAVFDIYYINKKSVREYAFTGVVSETDKKEKFRMKLMNDFVKIMKLKYVSKSVCNFRVECKKFYMGTEDVTIFQGCSQIMSNIQDGVYEYETDGLIFTPSNMAVGSDVVGTSGPLMKHTWEHSFKWKPAEFNTIDFLVTTKKNDRNEELVSNIFEEGTNVKETKVSQYKTLILRCGYNEKQHGYLNPFQDVVDGTDGKHNVYNEGTYKPVPFQPTNPYDSNACYANILLTPFGNDLVMMSEEGEPFEENMIVEFKYDLTKPGLWKWIPLKVRYDKTAELKAGGINYGNAYHVANQNWNTIHNPITIENICENKNIPTYVEENIEEDTNENESIYYNRNKNTKKSQALRDFHNLYVKHLLIHQISNKKDTLIDYAVGSGGDLPKWIDSQLSFVFGIDIMRDNIHNRIRGACARYLNHLKLKKNIPQCLFVTGNSGLNIRNGDAYKEPFGTKKDKEISNALFGNGPKDQDALGRNVYKKYGVASEGFHVSSCQFALHYFFENESTMHGFIRNIAETTKLNGHFIGTCFDGASVFNILQNKNKNETLAFYDESRKTQQITKLYNETGFSDDETSLGYKIEVFQDSIGKPFVEYLVNFEYFTRIMENYGFVLLSKEESKPLGFPNGTGLFEELYKQMMALYNQNPKISKNYKNAHLMTDSEKTISFLNRYFIFRKVRNVNADKIMKHRMLTSETDDESVLEVETKPTEPAPETKEPVPDTKEPAPETTKAKKVRKKIKFNK